MDSSSQPQDSLSADVVISLNPSLRICKQLARIHFRPDTSMAQLLVDIKGLLWPRNEDRSFKDKIVDEAYGNACNLIRTKSDVAPIINFQTTIHTFTDEDEHQGMVVWDHSDWRRFQRISDLTCNLDALRASKIVIQIWLIPSPEGYVRGSSPVEPSTVSPVRPPESHYVRVGTIQSGSITATKFTELQKPKAGEVPMIHTILAEVNAADASAVANNLRIVSAWDLLYPPIGDVEQYRPATYGEISKKGTGLFGDFDKAAKNKDKTELASEVKKLYEHQCDIAEGREHAKAEDQRMYAPDLPAMTLNQFDPSSIGNVANCTLPDGVDGRAAICVFYHRNQWGTPRKYPQTTQIPFSTDMSVQGLEDKLFQAYQDKAGADVNYNRTKPWECRWWFMFRTHPLEKNVMVQVDNKDTTLATYIPNANTQKEVQYCYFECHMHYADEFEEKKIGYGLNTGPGRNSGDSGVSAPGYVPYIDRSLSAKGEFIVPSRR